MMKFESDPNFSHRSPGMGASLHDWLAKTNGKARVATFAEAAAHGEIVINATSGTGSARNADVQLQDCEVRVAPANALALTITAHIPPCCATFTTGCCDARATIATP